MRALRRRKALPAPAAPATTRSTPQGAPGCDAQAWIGIYARRAQHAVPRGLPPTGGLLAASRTQAWREGRFTITDP